MLVKTPRKFRKVLVFQHVPFEPLGTLNNMLKSAGFRIRYVNFSRDPHAHPEIGKYAGLIVLGGPMNVDQINSYPNLRREVSYIRKAIKFNIPVLGICLGAQLVAKALGASVKKNPVKEIGWYPVTVSSAAKDDPVLSHFSDTQHIFQWHSDTFELPEKAVHLAKSETCNNQAFRFGDRIYGFQFHLEVNRQLIDRWLTVPVNRKDLKSVSHQIQPERIRRDTDLHVDAMMDLAQRTFGSFIDLFGLPVKRRLLQSR